MPYEPSARTAFSGNSIQRHSEQRTEDSLPEAIADASSRYLLLKGTKVFCAVDGPEHQIWHDRETAETHSDGFKNAILLGHDGGKAIIAAPCSMNAEEPEDGFAAVELRSFYMLGLANTRDQGALAQAASWLAWHDNNRFCARCGGESQMRAGGVKRVCLACQAEHFPRLDPVAIMLISLHDRCLLGRSHHFSPGRYSTLAGFIEAGETIENAVRREVFEEAAIKVGEVHYHASQPWPFAHSLMIGCYGEALNEKIDFDTEELDDCRWFNLEEVKDMLAGCHKHGCEIPPPGAIAWRLIADWVEMKEGRA
ncbi:NAD(+) diphosphatase [Limoniibacter endophyticus]|nr:NAD(+) diphosphatase [Limoniibacter endophyticus]